ncbi:MAG: type II and III secretion system family protein [Alphaproteobacteria bacterium]|nr:MAG: type II and III secretion system family protein [Alphaproteobacteria bacterium]
MSSFSIVKPFIQNKWVKFSLIACASITLLSCDLAANYTKTDRAANIEFQDFRDGLSERLPEVTADDKNASMASIPALQPYISATPESMKSVPLVSVSVNQTVPLKDILYELATQAEYDLELDPSIRGSIIFTARNKPFDLVIERICAMAGLRYKFEDSFLRIELDTPYIKNYKIDYLSFIRSNSGNVSTTVSVVSGEGADTGSSYIASSESTSDFWGELELNLEQILDGVSTGGLKTKRDPRITVAEKNPNVGAVAPQQDGDGVTVQPPEVVLNVESLPIDDDLDTADDEDGNGSAFSLNKQAGLISVLASERGHKDVEKYLTEIRRSITSQVLVEAKIFEVTLKDEYINGIQWQALTQNGRGVVRFLDGTPGALLGAITTPGGSVAETSNFGIGYVGSDVGAFIEAISGFGTVRALASPRLTVMNNQSAVLNVATNRVFFEIDLNRETDDDTGDVTLEIDTEIKTVPEGVLINVQPSINLEDRTISMFIRPTVTNIVNTVQDPSIALVGAGLITSVIPEVNVQEIDTVVRVNSGQPIVMGGLLQDRVVSKEESVPVLGEIPVFGNLFRTQDDLISKTELVIFLKATILDSPADTIHNTDRDLYKAFSGDRRPFKL